MEDLIETKIIKQLKKNDFSNFNIIYENYYKKIYFLSLKMIKDEKIAEDITQEVFLSVIKCISSLKNIAAFEVWIRKITINKVNTKIKYIIKYKQNTSYYDFDSLNNLISENELPEELALKKEDLHELFNEINRLPDIKRRVLLLHYFKELSLKEISVIENIPIGTVKSRIFSAKSSLKKSLSLKKL
ncbi:RNA polymerase sigma factor [Clostridium perfringens]|uniref:RNA polymerase sigma factor n=1 Tax=Clostridium perfringens TaxID=1502 RepID=UPI002246368B|nr:RNA polymerase sigma factor [Clostridium perfringens]MCX0362351.1 RNA polymerase sigma factor [Clostridium perfringens]